MPNTFHLVLIVLLS